MKLRFVAILIIVSFFSAYAQKSNLIQGMWKFHDIADKEKLDSLTIKEASILFGKLQIEFASNGKYFYNQTEMGTWALNKKGDKVIITVINPAQPNDKKNIEWEIKNLKEKELKLNMGKAVIVFDRLAKEEKVTTISEPKEADKNSKEIYNIFNRYETDHRNKVKELLTNLEASMVMNDNGEFLRRGQWFSYSQTIKSFSETLDANIKEYNQQLLNFNLNSGENELHDRLIIYLKSTEGFSSSCKKWAYWISMIDVDNETILDLLTDLENSAGKMKNEDNEVWDFIPLYEKRNGL